MSRLNEWLLELVGRLLAAMRPGHRVIPSIRSMTPEQWAEYSRRTGIEAKVIESMKEPDQEAPG